MKKLMITAAIVCAAALSEAATFTWSSSKAWYGPEATAFANLKAGDVLNSATTGSGNTLNQLGQTGTGKLGVQWQMIMTITDTVGSEELPGEAFTSYSSNKPKISNKLASDKVYKPSEDDKVNFSYTMVVKGKYTDANGDVWTLTSDPIDGGQVSIGSLDELSFTSSAIPTKWTVSGGPDPVPEPTSGLLLLLGVAGLALRRKQK